MRPVLIAILGLLLSGNLAAGETDSPMTTDQAYQILLKTKLFGFGVKMGQQKPRDTDQAYLTLLKAPDDKELFSKLYSEGSIYSKLFALCALFHMDYKTYQAEISKLDKGEKIRCRFGCVVDDHSVGDLIENIANSKYEYMYQRPNKMKRIPKDTAQRLVEEYLKKKVKQHAEYDMRLHPYGNATWFVDCYRKRLEPALPWRHLVTAKGEVKEINDDSLNVLFMNEFPLSAHTEKEKEKVIKAFLAVYSRESIHIINKPTDIPGYDRKPLDPDLAKVIQAPYSPEQNTSVVYTYQSIGGIVRRFRFTWTEDQRFSKADVMKMAKGIGAAQYYE